MLKLRNYQNDLINKCRTAFINNYKRLLCVLPCGAGKTVCFAYMAYNHINRNGKVWFLVHRQELIDQTIDTFTRFNIPTDNIYIGMVGTALKNAPFEPTLIIFDEGHHATARTWEKIINKYPFVPLIGLTATPCRLDGTPLNTIYDNLIVGVSSEWLINNHYLAPYDYYAPANLISDFKSDTQNSEFEFDRKIYGNVLNYLDPNKKTIIYCPNINFSLNLQKLIPNSVHFDGNTPKRERAEIVRKFKSGEIKTLLNVDLIGEGFDVPDCECVILLRPTMSTALFIQQSMRCMRYQPNKRAVIYDFVGNVFRHGLPTETREWSLNSKIRVRNKSAEPDILTRMCNKCYRIYSGTNPICPYCHNDNGKTAKQIEIDNKQKLEQIKKLERRKTSMARTLDDLINLGISRGYKNPRYWAMQIMKSRERKYKNV